MGVTKLLSISLLILFLLTSIAYSKTTTQRVTVMVTVIASRHAYLPDNLNRISPAVEQSSSQNKWQTVKTVREGQPTLLYTMVD